MQEFHHKELGWTVQCQTDLTFGDVVTLSKAVYNLEAAELDKATAFHELITELNPFVHCVIDGRTLRLLDIPAAQFGDLLLVLPDILMIVLVPSLDITTKIMADALR